MDKLPVEKTPEKLPEPAKSPEPEKSPLKDPPYVGPGNVVISGPIAIVPYEPAVYSVVFTPGSGTRYSTDWTIAPGSVYTHNVGVVQQEFVGVGVSQVIFVVKELGFYTIRCTVRDVDNPAFYSRVNLVTSANGVVIRINPQTQLTDIAFDTNSVTDVARTADNTYDVTFTSGTTTTYIATGKLVFVVTANPLTAAEQALVDAGYAVKEFFTP